MRLGYLARYMSCVRSPALKNLDVVAHTCNHRVWEARGSGVQGQTQLHNKWEASLRYMRSDLKKGGGEMAEENLQPLRFPCAIPAFRNLRKIGNLRTS